MFYEGKLAAGSYGVTAIWASSLVKYQSSVGLMRFRIVVWRDSTK